VADQGIGDALTDGNASVVEEVENQSAEAENKEGDPNFDSKFAALSRREKALRSQEDQITQKLSQLDAMMEKFNSSQTPAEPEPEKKVELPLEYRLKKDPLNTLNELGLSYEQLTNLALNDGKLTPEMQIQLLKDEMDSKYNTEIESLRNELVERDKKNEQTKYEETINGFKSQITDFVDKSEEFELIKANNARDLIYDVIEEHHGETGRVLDIKEAAELVESHLLEETKKLMKLNKIKSLMEIKEEPQDKRQPQVTLSNSQSARVPNQQERKIGRDDSVLEAAKLLRWQED
jgi:hypothetical protein